MATANPMKSYRRYRGGRPKRTGRRVLTALLALILIGVMTFCALLGAVLAGERDRMTGYDAYVVVILGCQVMPSGDPSILLRDRLDTALDYLESQPQAAVIVSGGQGENEPMSEAQCMYEYLVAHGIEGSRILLEENSGNTYQNLCNAVQLMDDPTAEVVIVSNGFHLTRVRMLWDRISGGQDNLSTLAAPSSHAPSRLMMYLREPLALLKSFLFDRGYTS